MTRRKLIGLGPLLLLCFSSVAVAQNSLGHLKSWAGKYPTEKNGRVTTKFFGLPEIRAPFLRLLSRADFHLCWRTPNQPQNHNDTNKAFGHLCPWSPYGT